jgi:hypothetical protein
MRQQHQEPIVENLRLDVVLPVLALFILRNSFTGSRPIGTLSTRRRLSSMKQKNAVTAKFAAYEALLLSGKGPGADRSQPVSQRTICSQAELQMLESPGGGYASSIASTDT